MFNVMKTRKRFWGFGITAILALALLFTFFGTPVLQDTAPRDGSPSITIGQKVFTIGTVAYAAGTADYVCDGVADDVQFQAALDALPIAGGKLVVLAGTYNFTATVTRAIDNVIIEGVGYATNITLDGINPVFSAGAQARWVFRDIRTDGGGVNIAAATDWVKENIYEPTYTALQVEGDILPNQDSTHDIGATGNEFHEGHFDDLFVGNRVLTDNGTQLLVDAYSIPRTATLVVAASNASAQSLAQADYICDGTDDQVQIQAAINAVGALNGQVVLLEGTYNLGTAYIRPTAGYISLVGQGKGTVLKQNVDYLNGWMIYAEAGDFYSYIANMTLDVDGGHTLSGAILLGSDHCTVENIRVINNGNAQALRIMGDFNKIINYDVANTGSPWAGVIHFWTGADDNQLIDAYIDGGGISVSCIYLHPSQRNIIKGAYLIDGGAGIGDEGYPAALNYDGNMYINCVARDMLLPGGGNSLGFMNGSPGGAMINCMAYNIDGNPFDFHGCRYVKAINCSARDFTGGGFALDASIGCQVIGCEAENGVIGIDLWRAKDAIIMGNKVRNMSTAFGTGIRLWGNAVGVAWSDGVCERNAIIDNKCWDDQAGMTSNLTAQANSGQPDVVVVDVTDFWPGQWVNINDTTPQNEDCQIASVAIATNTLTMESNLANTYALAQTPKVDGLATQQYGIREINDGYTRDNFISGNEAHNNVVADIEINDAPGSIAYRQYCDIFMDVLAVTANHVRNNEDLSAGIPITFTIDAQPDKPRTLSGHFDSHVNITAYTIAIVGVDAKGIAITETMTEADGWDWETDSAFATITSITMSARTGTGVGDTMDIGITDVLGLSNVIYATGDVYKISKNNANAVVAGAQVDATYDTYDMAVIGLAGTDDFTIWFRSNLNIIN